MSSDWFRQAKRDFDKAKADLAQGYYEWASFTSQQAAEEALKAVYQKANKSARGHSVLKMMENLPTGKVPGGFLHLGKILDRYYIESRYPNGFPEGSPMDYFDEIIASEAVDAAGHIIRFREDTLGKL